MKSWPGGAKGLWALRFTKLYGFGAITFYLVCKVRVGLEYDIHDIRGVVDDFDSGSQSITVESMPP